MSNADCVSVRAAWHMFRRYVFAIVGRANKTESADSPSRLPAQLIVLRGPASEHRGFTARAWKLMAILSPES
jgi:hypothetical protein